MGPTHLVRTGLVLFILLMLCAPRQAQMNAEAEGEGEEGGANANTKWFTVPMAELLNRRVYLATTRHNELVVRHAESGLDLVEGDLLTHADSLRLLTGGLDSFLRGGEKEVVVPVVDEGDGVHGGKRLLGFVRLESVVPRRLGARRGDIAWDLEEGGPAPAMQIGNVVIGKDGAKTTSDKDYVPPPQGGGACITSYDCYNFNGTCTAGLCTCQGDWTGSFCQLHRPQTQGLASLLKRKIGDGGSSGSSGSSIGGDSSDINIGSSSSGTSSWGSADLPLPLPPPDGADVEVRLSGEGFARQPDPPPAPAAASGVAAASAAATTTSTTASASIVDATIAAAMPSPGGQGKGHEAQSAAPPVGESTASATIAAATTGGGGGEDGRPTRKLKPGAKWKPKPGPTEPGLADPPLQQSQQASQKQQQPPLEESPKKAFEFEDPLVRFKRDREKREQESQAIREAAAEEAQRREVKVREITERARLEVARRQQELDRAAREAQEDGDLRRRVDQELGGGVGGVGGGDAGAFASIEDLYGYGKAYPEPYNAGKVPRDLQIFQQRARLEKRGFIFAVRFRSGPLGMSFDNRWGCSRLDLYAILSLF